jgi:4-diphosphocytidyl-2-C-methyl-D-erythritol kinase
MIVFPNCKINLGLNVVRKREDGFHDIETIFYPIPFCDVLEIVSSEKKVNDEIVFTHTGFSTGANCENLCVKAYNLLKKDFSSIPPIHVHLHKIIPVGAGLGGGSADAAFTLMLLNKIFALDLSDEQILSYALELGSDCPFFIVNKPCIATGRGELMEQIDIDLSAYSIILVHPGIHIQTAGMFRIIKPAAPSHSLKEIISTPIENWRPFLKNDFEAVAAKVHPEIAAIKNKLYETGALYAAMSGSGSSVFGIFRTDVKPEMDFPENYLIRSVGKL